MIHGESGADTIGHGSAPALFLSARCLSCNRIEGKKKRDWLVQP
jgi:hypothetical protein